MESVEYAWAHDLGEIVGTVLAAGLRVVSLREYSHLAWKFFPWMVPADDTGRFKARLWSRSVAAKQALDRAVTVSM